jgi:hypothetical protein
LADVDEELDVAYLASLSDDAVPAMAAAFKDESLATLTHEGVGAALFCHRYINEDRLDEARPWQSFHLARRRAARIYVRLGDRLDGYTILEEDWPLTIISASGSKFVCQESFVWD